MMGEGSSVFDMIGPVMIGPSSSHTEGVVRIARTVVKIMGGIPDNVDITFYNSFAQTHKGHGSDKAIVAGLLYYAADDKRIRESFENAEKKRLKFTFRSAGNASTMHPNTIRIKAVKNRDTLELVGESRGGGVIRIKEFNGFITTFTTSLNTLIITAVDTKGSITYLANVFSRDDCNIAAMTVSRKGKNDVACQIIEMDSGLRSLTHDYLKSLNWVHEVNYIPAID